MAIAPIKIIITGIDKFSSKLAGSQKSIEKFARSVDSVGKKMSIALTVPIVAFGASMLKTAASFEMAMNRVQVLTRATNEEFVALQEQARELGAKTKFSANEAGDAMGFLAMSGFKTNEILAAMPGVLSLAAAANLDIARTADLAANVLRGYAIDAKEMNRVGDVLSYTMSNANTNMEELGEAMKFVAPIAAGMQIPFEQTAAAIGLLGNAGFKGAMAGTNLRQMLASLANPTREAGRVLQKLRIPKAELIDAKGNVKGIIPVIAALERQGATTADILELFGTKVGPAMQALVSQGAGPLRKFTEELEASGGTAQKIADVYTKGLAGQLKNLESAFEELQLAIADSGILEFATNFVIKVTDLLNRLSEVNPAFLKMAAIFAVIVAALGPLLVIIAQLTIAFTTISGFITGLGGTMALLTNPIGWIIAGVLILIALFAAMKAKFGMSIKSMLSGLLMFTGPLGWVVAFFMKHWGRILPYLKLIGTGFAALGELILYMLWPVFKLMEKLGDLFGWVSGLLLDLLDGIAKLVLPKWLSDKIGLTVPEGTPVPAAAGLTERAGMSMKNVNENKTTIRIDNRANAKVTPAVDEGDVDMEVGRGFAFAN